MSPRHLSPPQEPPLVLREAEPSLPPWGRAAHLPSQAEPRSAPVAGMGQPSPVPFDSMAAPPQCHQPGPGGALLRFSHLDTPQNPLGRGTGLQAQPGLSPESGQGCPQQPWGQDQATLDQGTWAQKCLTVSHCHEQAVPRASPRPCPRSLSRRQGPSAVDGQDSEVWRLGGG